MPKKELKEVIKKEIEWCEKNKELGDKTKEYIDGFIKGLEQAIFLLEHLNK